MRDFLKQTFATVLGILIFLGLSIGGLITLVILAASNDSGPQVKDKSVLAFDLSLSITDAPRTVNSLTEVFSSDTPDTVPLRSVLNAIDQAARDPRIVGLYLYGNEGTGTAGYATLKEVREALQRFRAAGKRIIAYDVNWNERDYYLGSVADTVVLNPSGTFEFNGLSSETMFYADALKKFGVGVQVTRVGKYKSAVEPFLLNKRSPENREQTEALLNDLWREVRAGVEKDRKLSDQQAQAIANSSGLLEPEEAHKRNLVDKVAYLDSVIDELEQITGTDGKTKSFRQISLKNYAKIAEDKLEQKGSADNQVAIVYAEGDIVSGQGGTGEVGGDRVARQLRQLRQDDAVKAVVLRVNSPGGSATASDIVQREVVLTRKVKPVVISMGSLAASGGYLISMGSDRIFAEPNTITGSIGVYGVQPNFQSLANRNGVTWDVVKTNRFSDINSVSRPRTPQELALLQKSIDQTYDQFITKVAESRKLPKAKVAEIAQGRVWSGQRAKELGLVDELGGLDAALQDAAKRAKLGDNWRVEEYPKSSTFEERLFGKVPAAQSATPPDPVTEQFKKLQAELASLKAMNDPRGVYMRLPVNFRIN